MSDLKQALKHSDAFTRERAAAALAAIGPKAKEAEALLAAAVQDRDTMVCRAAAHALACIGATSADALEGLRRALTDADFGVRLAAARALTDLAPHNEAIIQALTATALAGRKAEVKDRKALPKLPKNARARDDQTELRVQSLRALAAIGSAARSVAPKLTPLLRDLEKVIVVRTDKGKDVEQEASAEPDVAVRLQAIATLQALGATQEAVGGPLEKALQDRNPMVRLHAAAALRTMGEPTEKLAQPVREALASPDGRVRYRAAVLLTDWGQDTDGKAVQALLGLVGDKQESPAVRRAAAATLARLKQHLGLVEVYVLGAVTDPNPVIRGEALRLLELLPASKQLSAADRLKRLRDGLKDSSPYVQRMAVRTLGGLGAAAKETVPALKKLLDAKDLDLSLEAALALVRIDSKNQEAAELLTKRLGRPWVRGGRVGYLKTLAASKAELQALDGWFQDLAAHDPEPAVRRLAASVKDRAKKQ